MASVASSAAGARPGCRGFRASVVLRASGAIASVMPISAIDMPAMTIVFQVKDAALLDKVKPGDKVKFKAEKAGSGFTLTRMEVTK